MAKLPFVNVKTRMNPGSSPATMGQIQIRGPREIRAPQFKARSIEAPFYKTPIDEVGPLIRNKAINQFGEVLIDVTMSLADRKARLKAEEMEKQYYDYNFNVLKNVDDGFLLKEGQEAVDVQPNIVRQINDKEEELLDSVSNHTKIYLTPALRKEKNRVLEVVADHTRMQIKVAEKRALNSKVTRIDQNIKDMSWEQPKDVLEYINTEIESLPIKDDKEKQAYVDKFMGTYVQYLKDSVFDPNEQGEDGKISGTSEADMFARLKSLGNRVVAVKPYVSAAQDLTHRIWAEEAVIDVRVELDRRRVERDRLEKEEQEQIIERTWDAYFGNLPFPDRFLELNRIKGTISGDVKYKFERIWKQGDADSSIDFSTYADLRDRIEKGESLSSVNKAITLAVVESKIRGQVEGKELLNMISNMKDTRYADAIRRAKEHATALFYVTGLEAQYQSSSSRLQIVEYMDAFRISLNHLKDNNQLTRDNVDKLINKYKADYTVEVLYDKLLNLSTTDISLRKPSNFDELGKAAADLKSQKRSDEEAAMDDLKLLQYRDVLIKMDKLRKGNK